MNGNVKSSSKNKGISNKKTLDTQHSCYIKNLQEKKTNIEKLRSRINEIEEKLKMFESKKRKGITITDDEINMQLEYIDRKLELESEVRKIESEHDEIQYHTNTADILFKYYDLIEKGQKISIDHEFVMNSSNKNQNSILKYFFGGTNSNTSCSNIKGNEQERHDDIDNSRGSLLEKYMSYTDNNFVKSTPKGQIEECCCHCGSKNVTVMTNDGYTFCNDCHTMEYIIIDHDKPSYRDPPKEISYFAYKRINHFPLFCQRFENICDHLKVSNIYVQHVFRFFS